MVEFRLDASGQG